MSEKDNGGRAFPFAYETSHPEEHGVNGGMALRDYFAAKCLVPFLHGARIPEGYDATKEFEQVAGRAYAMADAMLKVRAK